MKSLTKCFDIVEVDTPEEGYDPISGEYSPEWEPECTRSTLANSRKGNKNKGLTAIRKGIKTPHEGQSRIDKIAAFIVANEEKGLSPFEGDNLLGGGQLRDDPLFEGLVKRDEGVKGIDPTKLCRMMETSLGTQGGLTHSNYRKHFD